MEEGGGFLCREVIRRSGLMLAHREEDSSYNEQDNEYSPASEEQESCERRGALHFFGILAEMQALSPRIQNVFIA